MFVAFGTFLLIINRLPWFQDRLWSLAGIVFVAAGILLFLRRLFWKRTLIITDHALVVPSGFLRLRAVRLTFTSVRCICVSELFGRTILLRTEGGGAEIQDLYLPNRTVFRELAEVLEFRVWHHGSTGAPTSTCQRPDIRAGCHHGGRGDRASDQR